MSKSLISYRVNLFACLFNVLVLACVVYGGAFPWVQLAAIAFNGAIAVGCKMSHNKQLSAAAVRDQRALEAKANEAIMCSQWEIRNTEAKMVDAGIIAPVEMTVCENEECQNCAPTRRAISEKNNRDRIRLGPQESANSLPIHKRQYRGYRQYDYEFQKWVREYAKTAVGGTPMRADGTKPVTVTYTCKTCGMLSTKPACGPCTAARAEEFRVERERKEAIQKALVSRNQNHQRVRKVEGIEVVIPNGIPSFAEPTMAYDSSFLEDVILWRWSYGEKELSRIQRLPQVETEAYVNCDGSGNVISRWQVPSTPSEHLIDRFNEQPEKTVGAAPIQLRTPRYNKGYM